MRLTDEEALKRQHRFVRDRAEDDRAHEVWAAAHEEVNIFGYFFPSGLEK